MRNLNALDRWLNEIDFSLRTLYAKPHGTGREDPSEQIENEEISDQERNFAIGLMRVDHAGEVSAQGLYRGQAATAKNESTRIMMQQSAEEENDHLLWCENRLEELGGATSLLGPFWYWGSFTVGALAGIVGDQWSLGFIDETEQQVVRHLDNHLQRLPLGDHKSRVVLQQMREDEMHHAYKARQAGGVDLPRFVRKVMSMVSKGMTITASRI